MNNNIIVLNKQIDLFIRDFFVDGRDSIDRNLRDYLISRLDDLVESSRVDLTMDEFKQSFVNICDKHGVLNKISSDRNESLQIINDLIENKLTLDDSLISQIEDHFLKSIKTNKALNILYERNWFSKTEADTNSILSLLSMNKDIDIKEMIGVVNTFIENSELDFSGKKPEIKSIIRGINQKSISTEPFKIVGGKVQYQRSSAGEFDFFMYDKSQKSYSISMSTKSQTTKIEGSSPFRHTMAMYYMIIRAYSESTRLKNENLSEREHILEFENQILKMDNFRPYNLNEFSKKEKESKEDKIRRNIKSITKNTDLVIKDFISMGILGSSVIRAESESSKHTSYSIDKCDLQKIKKHIDSIGVNCNVYYFGDVVSSNKKENTYSSDYTNEEIRAAANIFAYSNVGSNGFSGVNLTPNASTDFCSDLKVRFNTSTDKNKNCVDLIMLNNNIDKIIGVIVDKFTQFKEIDDILSYYDRNSKSKENYDVLDNITNIEMNLIDMISEEISAGVDPDTSYLITMSRFDVTPKVNLDEFLENMNKKYNIINESMVREGISKIENLKHKIDRVKKSNNLDEESFKNTIRPIYKEEILSLESDFKNLKINRDDYEKRIETIDKGIDDMYKKYKKAQSIMSKHKLGF